MQRLRHRPGEMLRSRDFRDQAALDSQIRWWHNTAVHNAFGVSSGLESEVVGTEVVVRPGLAYDIFGRELWLQETAKLSLPDSPAPGDTLILMACYRKSLCDCHGEELEGSCLPGEAPQRIEQLQLVFADTGDPSRGVRLATLTFTAGHWTIDPARYRARALAGPHVGRGRTISGQTIWTEREVRVFWTEIDTSAAGFREVPCYFAWINGPRLLPITVGENQITGLVWPLYVENSLAHSFQFAIGFVPLAPLRGLNSSILFAALRSENYVSWLGIEKTSVKP